MEKTSNEVISVEAARNANAIVVDDGSVKVPIRNLFGDEIGLFYFRPTDLDIINRFNNSVERFEKVVEPLEKIDLNSDGSSDSSAGLEVIEECRKNLYDLCDYVFDGDSMAAAFFGKMHPFSIVGGRLYCENALNVVGQYISKRHSRETKRFMSRINRYVGGYTQHGQKTGKHKNGKTSTGKKR